MNRLVLAMLLCCACGKWVHVGEETISLKPTLEPLQPGFVQLVASTSVRADGLVAIEAHSIASACTRRSVSKLRVFEIERYEWQTREHKRPPLGNIMLGGAVAAAVGVALVFIGGSDASDPNDPSMPRFSDDEKVIFQGLGYATAGIGVLCFGIGLSEFVKESSSPRKTERGMRKGPSQEVPTPCPVPAPLRRITLITPWGERIDVELDNGHGTFAIDWKALAQRATAPQLAAPWRLIGASGESDWKPSPDELRMFERAWSAERSKLDALEIAKRRKQTGPPSYVITATSEYEVVPAGMPTKVSVRIKNPGPGPADSTAMSVTVPGVGDLVQHIGPLAVGATVDREVVIKLPANHPDGPVRFIVYFDDPGLRPGKNFEASFTLTAAKQLTGAATVVIEKLEARAPLRAGSRGELRLVARNDGAVNAYGVAISMTSPKTPALDSLKHRIPYIKAGATVDVAIPIELPREIEDPTPTGLVNATVINGSSRCAGALTNCYAKLSIKPPPMPILDATCSVVEGATQSKDKRLTANAGVTLSLRCRIENKGDELGHITAVTGIDKAATQQPTEPLAPGAVMVSTFKIAVPRDSVAMSVHELVVELRAPHAITIERRIAFRIGRVALCAPNSLDKAEYQRKTDELKRSRDAGEITQQEYDQVDAELLGCLKK